MPSSNAHLAASWSHYLSPYRVPAQIQRALVLASPKLTTNQDNLRLSVSSLTAKAFDWWRDSARIRAPVSLILGVKARLSVALYAP